jgi:predicted N-acetyltransferase YhbS
MAVEIRAARLDERPDICKLINLAYDAEPYGPGLANPVESVGESHMDPHDRPENTRVLLADGQLVSTLHIWEREAHVCGQTAHLGIVTAVATHPEHRRKGYVCRLMKDAEEYMRQEGWAYGLLAGRFRTYGGSIGWQPVGEKRTTLTWKYVAQTRGCSDPEIRVRPSAERDVAFLSRVYSARYSRFFGPVVRSHDYWHRWSLKRTWEGEYFTVLRNERPIGYFRANSPCDSIDEIGWMPAKPSVGVAVFAAAASWAMARGVEVLSFWIGDDETTGLEALRAAFGNVTRVYCRPDGQVVHSDDPARFRLENSPDGVGIMTAFLNPGPGILAAVDSTEALTDAMARHSWVYLDGDAM